MAAKVLIIIGTGLLLPFIQREDRNRWSHITPAHAWVITVPSETGGEPKVKSFNPLAGQCIAGIDKNTLLESKLPGISNDEARDFVASALSKAGILFGSDDCTKQRPPARSLRLRLEVSTVEKDNYVAYHTTLHVMETMARQFSFRPEGEVTTIDVPIWRSEELAIVKSSDVASDIRSSIAHVSDDFCQAFLKANPP